MAYVGFGPPPFGKKLRNGVTYQWPPREIEKEGELSPPKSKTSS